MNMLNIDIENKLKLNLDNEVRDNKYRLQFKIEKLQKVLR